VGALVAVGLSPITQGLFGKLPGILGILLASINIFGGFLVTQRMLKMYKKNKKK
ncbi:MAG: NAD(P) transhydrogenase subunit alpha, partial [Candidatus Fonsibacter ubiquis]|nr:NAD(P) transhydrogenase subunit alpha [Candidatus Fonsibacter ubiquis]